MDKASISRLLPVLPSQASGPCGYTDKDAADHKNKVTKLKK
jgi:hypothetical protein